MRIFFYLLFPIFIVVCSISCKKLVTDEFSYFEPVPVVNAFLVPGKPLALHLSLAQKLDSTEMDVIEDANIDLYVDSYFIESLTYIQDGYYQSAIHIESGKNYTCKVYVPGFETIECVQQLLPPFSITGIEHINIAGKDQEGTSYPAVKVTFENNPDLLAYYEMEIRQTKYENASSAYIHSIVDPIILNEGLPILLFSNEAIKDSTYTILVNYHFGGAGKTNNGPWRYHIYPFVVELRTVTYEYYRFKKQLYLYDEGRYADGIITSMTNSSLYSNITKGYGIFAGYSTFVSDTIKPNTDGYYN